MLLGQLEVSMDDRGRLAMPKRYLDDFKTEKSERSEKIAGQLVISPDAISLRPCLLLYALDEWAKIEEQIRRFPAANKECQDIKTLFAMATDVELDDKGRFVVPSYLLEFIELPVKKKTCLVGQHTRLELWDKELRDADVAAARDSRRQAIASGQQSEELSHFVM